MSASPNAVGVLEELALRVEAGSGISNWLDAEIEIALFSTPEYGFASVRRNAASTKLIYTDHGGKETTCWAKDWTMDRPHAASLLRACALASEQVQQIEEQS